MGGHTGLTDGRIGLTGGQSFQGAAWAPSSSPGPKHFGGGSERPIPQGPHGLPNGAHQRPMGISRGVFGAPGASSSSTQSKHRPRRWDLQLGLGGGPLVTWAGCHRCGGASLTARRGFLVSVPLPEALSCLREGLCRCRRLLLGASRP